MPSHQPNGHPNDGGFVQRPNCARIGKRTNVDGAPNTGKQRRPRLRLLLTPISPASPTHSTNSGSGGPGQELDDWLQAERELSDAGDETRAMHDSSDMTKFVWRRQHGTAIVGEVRADGRAAWSASVWLQSNTTVAVRAPKSFESRHAACAKADALTRTVFDHTCETPACGDWFPFDVSATA